MTAESYHLKWDSHHSYLNSSVATLYKNEKYADVVLYSSSNTASSSNNNTSIPTVGISAHKFILSSCSQFFSTIFETSPITNNGVFYIVLPPDLSHRAIQILVQYMYVGEATVSNDILNEVLRGGEILKIRGLCRNSSMGSSTMPRSDQPSISCNTPYNGNQSRLPLNGGATSVRYLVEQQQQQHLRGLGASVMPKDSPVIIKSPKPLGLLTSSTGGAKSSTNIGSGGGGGGITVNKEVAIDPEDKCCFTTESMTTAPLLQEGSSICNEIGCSNCSLATENSPVSNPLAQQQQQQPMLLRRERSQSDEPPVMNCSGSYMDHHISRSYHERPDDSNREYITEELRRSSVTSERTENLHDYSLTENYKNYSNPKDTSRTTSPIGSAAGNFVTIKQEPTDWLATSNANNVNQVTSSLLQQKALDFKLNTIKTETSNSCSHSTNEEDDRSLLPPPPAPPPQQSQTIPNNYERYLTCDICNKTYDDKSSLMRHLDTHTATPCSSGFVGSSNQQSISSGDTKSYVPKKRRRISQQENNVDHVSLQCDLCNTPFETAAEWVRHMNCQHTEIELAIFNSKKDKEQKQINNSNSSSTGVGVTITTTTTTIATTTTAAAASAAAATITTATMNNNLKKLNNNRQQQRTQMRNTSNNSIMNTNLNLSTNTSVLCSSSSSSPPLPPPPPPPTGKANT
uniref:BTB domain-containing protein n=1 Tax=Glossina brevipalpis TaxID=37001 RepID=A0A1A9WTG6_9MUSC